MFLRYTTRKKNGKLHRYWSIVENKRVSGGKVVQRHALYLGEITSVQQEAWEENIEIFQEGAPKPKKPELLQKGWREHALEGADEIVDGQAVRIRACAMELTMGRVLAGLRLV